MYFKIILHIILALVLSLIQITFVRTLFEQVGYFNLVLLAMVFVLVLSGFEKTLIWAVTAGFIHDIYSFLPFGFFMACFLLTVLGAEFLLKNFFTDKSLYSFLALGVSTLLLFEVLFYSGVYLWYWHIGGVPIFLATREFWTHLLRGIILNSAAVFLCFYFFNFVSDRLNAVFLKR